MQQNISRNFEWVQKNSTQAVCMEKLNRYHLEHEIFYETNRQGKYCHVSLPLLLLRFAKIRLMGADKDGRSTQKSSKMVGVSCSIAYRILNNLRQSLGSRPRLLARIALCNLTMVFLGNVSTRIVARLRAKTIDYSSSIMSK